MSTLNLVRRIPLAALLVAGFAVAVWLRLAVGGTAAGRPGSAAAVVAVAPVAVSAPAGLIFAAALAALTVVTGTRTRLSARVLIWGAAGAAVLCLPPLLLRAQTIGHTPAGNFLSWAAVVTVVATAEEAFLRGALFDAVQTARGPAAALLVTSACFAALHVPLYGWHVVPLDLAVGLWLGALRTATGTWTAPALTHVLADLASWWLR